MKKLIILLIAISSMVAFNAFASNQPVATITIYNNTQYVVHLRPGDNTQAQVKFVQPAVAPQSNPIVGTYLLQGLQQSTQLEFITQLGSGNLNYKNAAVITVDYYPSQDQISVGGEPELLTVGNQVFSVTVAAARARPMLGKRT